jgi:hypothetical protein
MARTTLRLRRGTSPSWLPHWPACMCAITREDSIGFDLRFREIGRIASAIQNRSGPISVLIGSAVPEGRAARTTAHADPRNFVLHIAPYGPSFARVRNADRFYAHFVSMRFRAGDGASIFSVGPLRQRGGVRALPRRAGHSGISWRILFLLKRTLKRHRTGFEPQ